MTADRRVAPSHTDCLYHHLTITGPAEELGAFRRAASGAGIIPWQLDLDRMEDDYFLTLVAPRAGQARTLSLDAARMLAAALRDAVGGRHALATGRVGRSTACPLDLHALLPVPGQVLQLGPDHPDALSWLWTQWGTTQALRHVSVRHGHPPTRELVAFSFWSADWTPWRAFDAIRAAWPALRLDVQPIYQLA